MSKAPQEDDKAVLAALDGIVRMQRTIRGGLDVCVDTGLVFVRTYYNCQRQCNFVVFRRTENVEKWRVKVYSHCIIILAVFVRQA